MGKDQSNINKSYIREAFKQVGVQLSQDALQLIVHNTRKRISSMALRAKEHNIKRLTSDLMHYVDPGINKKGTNK